MKPKINIERNKIDYLLTDTMPVEISELFSYGEFYKYLLLHHKKIDAIVNTIKHKKANNELLFVGCWSSMPLKYKIKKNNDTFRELNLVQPISALNMYLFMECYQKEILAYFNNHACFSLRYHKKNNQLYYLKKSKSFTEYTAPNGKNIDREVIRQSGAYFRIVKYNSVVDFTNSKLWQFTNHSYSHFAKIDFKSCFDSIYTHAYKWIIAKNTVDSKESNNSNLFITIDRVLQNINGKSSNGLIVGPEFSRMIAELLLQNIDIEVKLVLAKKGLRNILDYRIFRYVDDVFIFGNTPEILDKIISSYNEIAHHYLLSLNELKLFKAETPVLMSNWVSQTRLLADNLSNLFTKAKFADDTTKPSYINCSPRSFDRFKDDLNMLIKLYPQDRRKIVSYILTTLLKIIKSKPSKMKLCEDKKETQAFGFLEYAFFVYSNFVCFDHTQKIISILSIFANDINFETNYNANRKLVQLFRQYSFVFENNNPNDFCNLLLILNEYGIPLSPKTEKIIVSNIENEDNPILWANFLIYSQYDKDFAEDVLQHIEYIINQKLNDMMPLNPLLQKELWYPLIFVNCPYIADSTRNNIIGKINELRSSDTDPCHTALNIICDFLCSGQPNLFFYWDYKIATIRKHITFRTYNRTLFRTSQRKSMSVIYGNTY